MTAPTFPEVKAVWARDLTVGDRVVNGGTVDEVSHVGAFVLVAQRTGQWSLETGTQQIVQKHRVWHGADTVMLHMA